MNGNDGRHTMALCPRCQVRHPLVVVEPEQLRPVRGSELDIAETRKLKQHIATGLRHRAPYAFLGLDDFRRIARWKLGRQLGRGRALEQLTESLVRSVTRAAFHLHADHKRSDAVAASVCVGVLTSLPGVGVPVASAVLALTFPADHCVVDFRGWRALFGEEPAGVHDQPIPRVSGGCGLPSTRTGLVRSGDRPRAVVA